MSVRVKLAVAALLVLGLVGFRFSQRPANFAPTSVPPVTETPDPSHTAFSAPSLELAFSYPLEWTLRADRRNQGQAGFLDLIFSTGRLNEAGEEESATVVVRRSGNAENTPLVKWVRDSAGDSKSLLEFEKCSFASRALECLEVSDQTDWIEAGRVPMPYSVFFRLPALVYSVAWGQDDTFDFRGRAGNDFLRSFRFGEK